MTQFTIILVQYGNTNLLDNSCLLFAMQQPLTAPAEDRFSALTTWLNQHRDWREGSLTALAGDASFRRYYRWQKDNATAMVMDAPPPQEDIRPFVQVQRIFNSLSVPVPEVYHYDAEQGFMLLQDFGDQLFAQAVTDVSESTVDAHYQQALRCLVRWQTHSDCANLSSVLPIYNNERLTQEMQLLPDWFLREHLTEPLSRAEQIQWQRWQKQLVDSALTQPQTLVHRDYHSRNIMITKQEIGIIDFQDAVQGALTYDAVSLLKDAYLVWPADQVTEWLRYYFLQLVAVDFVSQTEWSAFVQSFELMGLQRHLKVLGIFSRLAYRDGKMRYLADLPVVANYAWCTAKSYPQLAGMADWLALRVLEK